MTGSIAARRPLSTWLFAGCGVWLVGLGLYFMIARPALLPEDVRFMGTTLDHVRTELPELELWLAHVFLVLGGFIAGAGVLTMFIAGDGFGVEIRAADSATAADILARANRLTR